MKDKIIREIITAMSTSLQADQLRNLQNVLTTIFQEIDMVPANNAVSTEVSSNEKIIKNYLVCLKIEQIQDSTLKAYKYQLDKFLAFTGNADILKTEANTIRFYLIELERRGVSEVSRDNARRILKTFFQWLVDEEYLNRNPVAKIPKIKEPFRIKRYFTEYETEALRDACIDKRELALVDLLLSTGLRVSEVGSIKLNDVNWDEGSFRVVGKGNKERVCYLTVRAKKHILEYLDERKEQGKESKYLIGREKAPYDQRLGKNATGNILKKIGERCNITDIHVHGLRAYFATNLSDHGIPGETIQLLMGHESYSTTIRYYCRPNLASAKQAVLTCA